MLELEGIPSSRELLDGLAAEGEPVILNFSRGKDSLALWNELAEREVEVIPIHETMVPGLKFVEDDLKRYEDHFQVRIINLLADWFYRALAGNIDQAPEYCALQEATRTPALTRLEYDALIRQSYAKPDTWMLDGVRATDSPTRRMAIQRHGPSKPKTRRMSGIWDFHVADVRAAIARGGIELGVDYKWWKHSFDGLWYDYLIKIKENAPEDYETILFWFPMADCDILRGGWNG